MKTTTATPSRSVCDPLKIINGVRFTPREIDIIACLLSGKATKTIARFLSIEEKTVETHKYNVMRKLECGSKEGIIHFIEKSGSLAVVKKHYLGLLAQSAFEKSLQEASTLVGKDKPPCSLVYWREEADSSSFVEWAEKNLKLAGVEVLREARESYKSLNHLVHKIESGLPGYTLYILPAALVAACQMDSSKTNPELFPFIQKNSQAPGSIIFLLMDMPDIPPLVIGETGYVHFPKEDHYLPLLDILAKISPGVALGKVIAGFKEQYEAIYGPSGRSFSELWPEERSAEKENPEGGNIFLWAKRYKKGLLAGLVLCSLCFMGFLRGVPLFTHPSGKTSGTAAVRSELPVPHDNILLGRSDLVFGIDAKFKEREQDIKALALIGIGGSGKTVIARQYGRHQNGVVWEANAETGRAIRESFENLAYLLATTEEEKKVLMGLKDIQDPQEKEEKILLFVKEHLRASPGWLLILDNVGDISDIERYIPSDPAVWGKGRVLMTTRNGNMESHSAVHSTMPVKELDPEEKLSLFLKILHNGETGKLAAPVQEKARRFLEALPPFPLDVSVAAYYLKATGTSYEEYLRNISEYKSGFDSVQGHILHEAGPYSNTRYKIITLSLEKMMKGSKDFGEILLFASLMNAHNIPRELLDRFKDPVIVDGFIHHLKKYSLATHALLPGSSPISCLTVHGSTQDIALAYLIRKLEIGKDSPLLKDISRALDGYMDKALEEEDFLRMNISASHAEAFIRHKELLPDFIKGLIRSKLGCMYHFLKVLSHV